MCVKLTSIESKLLCYFFTKSFVWPLVRIVSVKINKLTSSPVPKRPRSISGNWHLVVLYFSHVMQYYQSCTYFTLDPGETFFARIQKCTTLIITLHNMFKRFGTVTVRFRLFFNSLHFITAASICLKCQHFIYGLLFVCSTWLHLKGLSTNVVLV